MTVESSCSPTALSWLCRRLERSSQLIFHITQLSAAQPGAGAIVWCWHWNWKHVELFTSIWNQRNRYIYVIFKSSRSIWSNDLTELICFSWKWITFRFHCSLWAVIPGKRALLIWIWKFGADRGADGITFAIGLINYLATASYTHQA